MGDYGFFKKSRTGSLGGEKNLSTSYKFVNRPTFGVVRGAASSEQPNNSRPLVKTNRFNGQQLGETNEHGTFKLGSTNEHGTQQHGTQQLGKSNAMSVNSSKEVVNERTVHGA